MAARKLAESMLEKANVRSIFIRSEPKPRNLAERRAILRAIQDYGDIEVFKQLRHPASFISIAARQATAQDLVDRSPLKFDYIAPPPRDKMPRLGAPALRPPTIEKRGEDSEQNAAAGDKDRRKAFTLHIFAAPDYKHKTVIRNSPLHGPWATEAVVEDSFLLTAMKKSIRKGYDAPGLRDWQSAGQMGDDLDKGELSADAGKAHFSAKRIARSEAIAKEKAESDRILDLLRRAHEAEGIIRR